MGDMPSMPIGTASVSWTDGGGGTHIRVYSTDGYKVEERCWDRRGLQRRRIPGFGDVLAG